MRADRSATGPRIIVALDYPAAAPALEMAARLDPERCRVKIGKELFTAGGPAVVDALTGRGHEVFLDLKFHDIPNTVAGACKAAAATGAWMINVHASGGRRMLEAARDALETSAAPPLLIAVTVLTSLRDEELVEVGVNATAREQVLRLARLARDCGSDGVVCSPSELDALRLELSDEFLRVTPGIRPASATANDQRRTATPAEALQRGAHHLVIGRPITAAADPMKALESIEAEIESAA